MGRNQKAYFVQFTTCLLVLAVLSISGCKTEEQAGNENESENSEIAGCQSDVVAESNSHCEDKNLPTPSLGIPRSLGEVPLTLERSPIIFWGYDSSIDAKVQIQLLKAADDSAMTSWLDFSGAFLSGLSLVEGESYYIKLRAVSPHGRRSKSVRSPAWTTRLGKGIWGQISEINAPSPRAFHGTVWTGSKMIVWGGGWGTETPQKFNTGGVYDPANDSWVTMSLDKAPSARTYFSTVWTGSEMIVWGGPWTNTGARYDPDTYKWSPMSTVGAPAASVGNSAVWTGSKMIVWGGMSSDWYGKHWSNDGAAYDPSTNTWSPISNSGAPSARDQHLAVWTGSKMIIWGGGVNYDYTPLNSGGVYDPATDTWSPISSVGAPEPRGFIGQYSGYVWTGSKLIIQHGTASDGGIYDLVSDTWSSIPQPSHPWDREDEIVLPAISGGGSATSWIGDRFFVWGGGSRWSSNTNTGGLYDPTSNTWVGTPLSGAPIPSSVTQAIWTGEKVLLWGGGVHSTYTPH